MDFHKGKGRIGTIAQYLFVGLLSASFTVTLFLVLPVMQAIGAPPERDLWVQGAETVALPPPPPPPLVEEEEPEQEEEIEPPSLADEAPPLELGQLELALNPGMGGAGFGEFAVNVSSKLSAEGAGSAIDEVFSMADLDQKPRVLFRQPPRYPQELREQGREGTVTVTFRVDTSGRVIDASVERATDAAFEKAALEAVRRWKFEPGKRKGKKVPFKLRIPISFSAG